MASARLKDTGQVRAAFSKMNHYFGNTARIGRHDFGNFSVSAGQIKGMVAGADAHDGHGTGG